MLVQWAREDRIFVLPFNDHIIWMERATGDEEEQASLLSLTLQLHADGGTDSIEPQCFRGAELAKPRQS
jgi:hypothetical protein